MIGRGVCGLYTRVVGAWVVIGQGVGGLFFSSLEVINGIEYTNNQGGGLVAFDLEGVGRPTSTATSTLMSGQRAYLSTLEVISRREICP